MLKIIWPSSHFWCKLQLQHNTISSICVGGWISSRIVHKSLRTSKEEIYSISQNPSMYCDPKVPFHEKLGPNFQDHTFGHGIQSVLIYLRQQKKELEQIQLKDNYLFLQSLLRSPAWGCPPPEILETRSGLISKICQCLEIYRAWAN